jgi:hypothetical protein
MALQPKSGPCLPFWGFVTIKFLRGLTVSPAPNPQPGGPGLGIYDPRRQGDPAVPRHWVPILVAFYDMHGLQWNYFVILATTRYPIQSSSSSSSYGPTAQIGPLPPLLGFRNNKVFTGLDC